MKDSTRVLTSAGIGAALFFFGRWVASHVVAPEGMTFVTLCILFCSAVAAVGINETILSAEEDEA